MNNILFNDSIGLLGSNVNNVSNSPFSPHTRKNLNQATVSQEEIEELYQKLLGAIETVLGVKQRIKRQKEDKSAVCLEQIYPPIDMTNTSFQKLQDDAACFEPESPYCGRWNACWALRNWLTRNLCDQVQALGHVMTKYCNNAKSWMVFFGCPSDLSASPAEGSHCKYREVDLKQFNIPAL